MKKLFFTLTLAACGLVQAVAQGTIVFNNSNLTRVQEPSGGGGSQPASFFNVAVYFAATPGEWQGPLLPLGRSDNTNPGLFTAPGGASYVIPGTTEGQTVFMQLFLWQSSYGDDPYQAWANGSATGATAVRQVTLGGAVNGPAVIWQTSGTNPNRFTPLQYSLGPYGAPPVVPEPSTIALAALGGLALLFSRRIVRKSL